MLFSQKSKELLKCPCICHQQFLTLRHDLEKMHGSQAVRHINNTHLENCEELPEHLCALLQHKYLNGALAIWSEANHLLWTERSGSVDNCHSVLKWSGAHCAMNTNVLLMGDIQ